jgi:hypothetical protein
MPLLLAWVLALRSLFRQFESWLTAAPVATVILFVVFSLVRRIEISTYSGLPRAAAYKYLFMALIPVSCTILLNFNVIYPSTMGVFLMREELEQKRSATQGLRAEAVTSLSNMDVQKWTALIDGKIAQLKSQILSPDSLGMGARAEAILQEIEKILDTPLTRHSASGRSLEQAERLAERYERDIIAARSAHRYIVENKGRVADLVAVQAMIDASMAELEKASQALAESKDQAIPFARDTLRHAVERYESIINRVRTYAPTAYAASPALTLENGEMGKVSHTLESAASHWQRGGTWLALLLSLLIDLWAICAALVWHSPKPAATHRIQESKALEHARLYRLQ